jgi:DNA-binding response OmpR family regulator
MMPKVDGYEVCRHLKKNHEGTKVIFLTAKSKEQDVQIGLGLGADLYLTKPFSNKELVSKVKNLLIV